MTALFVTTLTRIKVLCWRSFVVCFCSLRFGGFGGRPVHHIFNSRKSIRLACLAYEYGQILTSFSSGRRSVWQNRRINIGFTGSRRFPISWDRLLIWLKKRSLLPWSTTFLQASMRWLLTVLLTKRLLLSLWLFLWNPRAVFSPATLYVRGIRIPLKRSIICTSYAGFGEGLRFQGSYGGG